MNPYAHLLSHPLFSGFTETQFRSSIASIPLFSYGKDQVLHLQGEVCGSLDIVLQGSISIQSLDEEGNVFKVKVIEEGQVYGATLLFGSNNQYPMTVVSDAQTVVVHLKKPLVLSLCKANSPFLAGLLKIISDRAYDLTTTIANLSQNSLRENLLSYLQWEVNRQGSQKVKLDISKKELAKRLGVARTSVSRQLSKLREDGVLSYEGRTVTLHISSNKEHEFKE